MQRTLCALVLVTVVALAANVQAGPENPLAKQVAALSASVTQHAMRITHLEARLARYEAGPTPTVRSELELATFRKMLEDVETTRRAEREASRAQAADARTLARLDRLGLELTAAQKQKILQAGNDYRTKTRDLFTKLREEGADRDTFRAALEPLRAALELAIQEIVPGEDADKVIQALGSAGRTSRSR